MRVLLTVHQFFPDHTTGTEVLTLQVATELVKRGHNVRIVTAYPIKSPPLEGKFFDQYVYRGLRVDRYYHQESSSVGVQTNMAELEYVNHFFTNWFNNILEEWRPDIVHFFHLKNLSATSIDACRDLGIPMVFTPTDFWLVCPDVQLLLPDSTLCNGPDSRAVNCLRHAVTKTQSSAIKWLFESMPDSWVAGAINISNSSVLASYPPFSWACALSRRAEFLRSRVKSLDYIVAPTRFMENVLISNDMIPKKLHYSRFGIDLSYYMQPSVMRGLEEKLRVGFIGSLSHYKGAHVLINSMRLIPPDMLVELRVYGDMSVYPEYSNNLRKLAGDDSRITFCGTFPNESIGEVLNAIDVFVVPSLWYENTPLVIYSAQASGCPIVASNLAGMAEVVRDGVDGMLFPSGESSILSSLIMKLCMDRDMVRKMASNAPRPKSIVQYTDEIDDIYHEIQSNGGE